MTLAAADRGDGVPVGGRRKSVVAGGTEFGRAAVELLAERRYVSAPVEKPEGDYGLLGRRVPVNVGKASMVDELRLCIGT